MRRVTRKSLDGLAKVMPVISEENQKMYIGGTSGYTGTIGVTDVSGYYAGEGVTSDPYIPNNGVPFNGVVDSGSAYTSDNPCPYDEFDRSFASGTWLGGFVEGMGYVGMQIISTPSGVLTPMGGEFVTAADLLGENNADDKGDIVSGIVDHFLGGVSDGTGAILNVINTFGGNSDIAAYFKQNPDGQLYRVTQKYLTNTGVERTRTTYYDGNRLIAIIMQ